jgi:hypothetical protein
MTSHCDAKHILTLPIKTIHQFVGHTSLITCTITHSIGLACVELNKCFGTTVFTEILFLKYFLLDFYCLLHHLMFIEVKLRYNHNYRSDLYYALFFPIVTLPFLRCNISTTHVYEVNISSYVKRKRTKSRQ